MRLRYFDILKGLAIFLVVMGHVLAMCIRGIDSAPLFKIIGQIHMPLFFFISGWLAMRVNSDGTPKATPLLPKAKRLLLPALVVSLLWIWYYPSSGLESPFEHSWWALLADSWKYGYWFTPVLFVIFLLYIPSAKLFPHRPSFVPEVAVVAGVWMILVALVHFLPVDITGYLSLDLVRNFYPAFMMGALARRHADAFGRLVANPNAVALAIVTIALTVSYVGWYWLWHFDSELLRVLVQPAMHFAIAIVGIAVVKPWSDRAFAPLVPVGSHRWARMWEYIGRRSLAIYLLHYFFLFPLGSVRSVLQSMNLDITPTLIVSAVVATVIVAIVLVVDYILSFAGPLSLLLTGSIQQTQK